MPSKPSNKLVDNTIIQVIYKIQDEDDDISQFTV